MAKTIASRVSKFKLNPSAVMMIPAPTRDSGMVTIGISTERKLPRKRKITTTTIPTAKPSEVSTSSIEAVINLVES